MRPEVLRMLADALEQGVKHSELNELLREEGVGRERRLALLELVF